MKEKKITTIACNLKSIACDLQFTHNMQTKFKGGTKILTLEGSVPQEMFGCKSVMIGFSGSATEWGNVIAWYFDNPFENKPPKIKNTEFLMLTSKRQIFSSLNLRNWVKIEQPYFAIGSGSQFATAALAAGKTPEQAIEIASQHDLYTGMGVMSYNMKKEKGIS